MKARVDSSCIGCGMCVNICPKVFRMNDDERAESYCEFEGELVEQATEAADACPVAAIELE